MDAPVFEPALERRRHRTENALEALTHLLEAARKRSGADAFTLADSAGLMLAGAGAAELCEELSAWAPVVSRQAANDSVPNCLDVFDGRTRLRRLTVDGIEMVVSTLAGNGAVEAELDAVSAGCARILKNGRSAR